MKTYQDDYEIATTIQVRGVKLDILTNELCAPEDKEFLIRLINEAIEEYMDYKIRKAKVKEDLSSLYINKAQNL